MRREHSLQPGGRGGARFSALRRLAWIIPALALLCAGVRGATPATAATYVVTISGTGVTGSAPSFALAAQSGISTALIATVSGATCANGVPTYTWTFTPTGGGPQSLPPGSVTNFAFTTGGQVILIVTDSCNNTGGATLTVTVGGSTGSSCVPNPPAGNPITVQVIGLLAGSNQQVTTAGTGQLLNFIATAFGGTGGLSYAWSFGDGATSPALASNSSSHTYSTGGTFTVTATVADAGGHVNCGTLALTITGSSTGGGSNPKITVAPNGPYSGAVGQAITFGGFAQTLNGGATITGYSWTFGDGSFGSGQSVSHAYSSAGTYTVTLTVTDSTGQSGSNMTTATIGGGGGSGSGAGTTGQNSERGVTVNTGGPYNGSPGATITLNGSATTTNAGATITSYTWNFGDNTTPGTGQSTTHTYASAGSFTLTLTVTDSTGVAVAATAIVSIGGSGGSSSTPRTVSLVTGCNNVSLTFPDNTPTGTVANGVSPSAALLSVWKLVDPAASKYRAFFPGATQATDLPSVNRLDAVFICVNASATFTEPGA